jgi:AcrR family transcriptional regulator
MTPELGLRERKKEQTRKVIADTARGLFVTRGFERVTVAEIARAANVSEATVFNYFPTKEDLVYYRMEIFETEMLAAIRERPAGESILGAFGRFILEPRGLLAAEDEGAVEILASITRVIAESPALLARERQILDRYARTLAWIVADETGRSPDDVEPYVIANALIGAHRALLDFTRGRILAGARNPRLAREVRAQGKRALAVLEQGLDRV